MTGTDPGKVQWRRTFGLRKGTGLSGQRNDCNNQGPDFDDMSSFFFMQ
jgi:hypothetical protein